MSFIMNQTPDDMPMEIGLSWLLSPIEGDTFAKDYFERRPLRITRQDATYYSQLLPEADLEFAVYMAARAPAALDVLNEDNKPVTCNSHEQALAAIRHGSSLRIQGIQRFSRPITEFCRNLERDTNHPLNVNMYLTPGDGKKALDRHYDTHDVFVLQIHGNKTWRIYDRPLSLPLEYIPPLRHESRRGNGARRQPSDISDKETCALVNEFVLKAGDCLYLPRGFWHEAESSPGEISCHLTVGVQAITYLDVLTAALSRAALSDIRLRESVPFGFATNSGFGKSAAIKASTIVQDIPGILKVDDAISTLAVRFLRTQGTGLENDILQPFARGSHNLDLKAGTEVHVQKGIICRVDMDRTPPRMNFGSQAFEVTPGYAEACCFIAKTQHFVIDELPGELAFEQKSTLVGQLISEGLLTLSKDNDNTAQSMIGSLGWFPIRIEKQANIVQWLNLTDQPFTEPFFHQTIMKYKKDNPRFETKITPLDDLARIKQDIAPSGFIFHISRCGSTLLSNALKAVPGTVVISEPEPAGQLLSLIGHTPLAIDQNDSVAGNPDDLLVGLVNAFGQRRTGKEKALVIKFSSWNILYIATIRRLWPQVPCVIIIRDPVEVAVSCLENPPGWMRWKAREETAKFALNMNSALLGDTPDASFCAQILGEFLKRAAANVDDTCQVIDYTDLTESRILDVARLFGLEGVTYSLEAIQDSLSRYSKDPRGLRTFVDDCELKQTKANDTIRDEVLEHAQSQYEYIKSAEACSMRN